jgi:hypothetical protein
MDARIMTEFSLSAEEYNALLNTLITRFNVQTIEDVAFLSEEQIAGEDRWEAAALKRLFDIAVAHIGIEKLYRRSAGACTPDTDASGTEESETETCEIEGLEINAPEIENPK